MNTIQRNILVKEAIEYFKSHSGFDRLFHEFRKKYESLGRIGGTVPLDLFDSLELDRIALFLGLHPEELIEKGKLHLQAFEARLEQTKFAQLSLLEVLEAYFGESLISKKELRLQTEKAEQAQINQYMMKYPNLSFWFEHLLHRTVDTHWIYRLMADEAFEIEVAMLSAALAQLPETMERLPVFSQKVTGDPHAFDLTGTLGKLWIHVLHTHQRQVSGFHPNLHVEEGSRFTPPSDTESINDLLLQYQLLRDDITNDVTCVNIVAETADGVHPVWDAAAATCMVMNVPLRELVHVVEAYPKQPDLNQVWVVENSGVFSSLTDAVPDAPLICTHGQFNLAALKLLDVLVSWGYRLIYSGDIDPEGLSMADRLMQRYPGQVDLWRMDEDSYGRSISDVTLSFERLAKLESLVHPELQSLAVAVKKFEKAGYQEALLSELAADMERDL